MGVLAEPIGEVPHTADGDVHVKTEADATVNPQPSGSGRCHLGEDCHPRRLIHDEMAL